MFLSLLSRLLFKGWPILLAIIATIVLMNWYWRAEYREKVETMRTEQVQAVAAETKRGDARVAAELAKCAASKQITMETDNAYHVQIADLNARLVAAKRLQPNRCIPVTPARVQPAGGTAGTHAAPPGGYAPALSGVNSSDILDLGASCEQIRLQLTGLQDFVSRTWAINGQRATP